MSSDPDQTSRAGLPHPGEKAAPRPPKPAKVHNLPIPKRGEAQGGQGARVPALRPPVSSTFARLRHFMIALSFVLIVIVPTGGTAYYLWAVAVDQYASSVGFSVRREDAGSATDVLSGLAVFSGTSSSTDTDILYEYLQSQKLVSEMDAEIDLRARWSKPEGDPVFALEPDASIEELMRYWDRMVRVSYGSGSGLIEVEVRAFTADDATTIAERLFEKSSDMINQLSAIAREDGIRYTREELTKAEDRLRAAREDLTRFRNLNQIVDPELDLRSQAGLLGNLQAQKAEALIELDLLRGTARPSDPRIEQAQRRLVVIDERISQERRKLGGTGQLQQPDDEGFANLIGAYEGLVVDREFAQEAYIAARAAHDSAISEARRKSRYLAAYMEPTRAETAAYPKRLTLLSVAALFLFLVWGIGVLIYYSIKDRR